MNRYIPPFTLDYAMLGKVVEIAERLGQLLQSIRDVLRQALETGGAGDTLVKTPVKTRVKTRVKTEDAPLAILTAHPGATLAEAAAHLGKSVSVIERAARRLREDGRLRYVGPQKGGRWEVME